MSYHEVHAPPDTKIFEHVCQAVEQVLARFRAEERASYVWHAESATLEMDGSDARFVVNLKLDK